MNIGLRLVIFYIFLIKYIENFCDDFSVDLRLCRINSDSNFKNENFNAHHEHKRYLLFVFVSETSFSSFLSTVWKCRYWRTIKENHSLIPDIQIIPITFQLFFSADQNPVYFLCINKQNALSTFYGKISL